jgi:secondary thiamine-phosphate synthase enzyme
MKSITVKSNEREEMLEITREANKFLAEQIENHPVAEATTPLLRKEGSLILFTQHTTCGLTINENADPDVKRDMLAWLRWLVPQFPDAPGGPVFKHFEHNSDAHIKSSMVGSSVTVPFENGKLLLGRWQGIYLCEFDGPRERKVIMQIIEAQG